MDTRTVVAPMTEIHTVELVVSEWRMVQRQIRDAAHDSEELVHLHGETDRLRREYQSLVGAGAARFVARRVEAGSAEVDRG